MPIALTIAGSDSSGGAGIQADLKVFTVLGVYGASVLTALTAQNTCGVKAIHAVPAEFVGQQIEAVATDLHVSAIKTGMLNNEETVLAVVDAVKRLQLHPLVVDPVMVATSGDMLLEEGAVRALRDELLPLADLITPNLPEAARLLDARVAANEQEMEEQARALVALGCKAVVVKGGHGTGSEAVDILFEGENVTRFSRPRIETRDTHGTGCAFSAAVTAGLARGENLYQAVALAKDFVHEALAPGGGVGLGKGRGPINVLHASQGPKNGG